jgi:hypothetical protein
MFAASKTDAVGTSGDPYWSNVSLLTNFENNLSFIDESANNFQIARFSINPNLRTPFSSEVGGSLRFPGASNNYLDVLNSSGNASFSYGSGDVTIECWVYHSSISGTQNYYRTQGGGSTSAYAFRQTNGQIEWFVTNSGGTTLFSATSAAGALTANAWYHLAIVRNGNVHTIYVNGVANGTPVTASYSAPSPAQNIGIGRGNFTTSEIMSGFISNLRVVKGTAVYTANFTPPTSPLTAISGTSLLLTGTGQGMFNNSTFVDQGPNALTVTATGSPLYSGLSPFGNSYPGSINAVSASSQYLTVATNAAFTYGTGNFTIECWAWFSTTGAAQYLIDQRNSGTATALIPTLYLGTDAKVRYYVNGADQITGTTAVSTGTWYHITVCRSGTNTKLFLNGVQEGSTYSDSNNYAASRVTIGSAGNAAGSYLNGRISNVRLVKGTALYTSNFTPSTTPLTSVTTTSLLIRGDTGAFYDLSNNGNPEANTGTTAVTTQIKKYGSESASYTATAYQTVSDATNLQLGTGDYTIEMWVYRNAAGVLHSLACKGASSTGWLLQVNTSNQLVFTVNRTDILTSTTTIGATIWAFVTVTRSGTTTRLFVNGNLEATATDSTNFNQTDALKIGADRSNLNSLNGYLDDIRITKGVARYTSSFTAPTQTFPTGP